MEFSNHEVVLMAKEVSNRLPKDKKNRKPEDFYRVFDELTGHLNLEPEEKKELMKRVGSEASSRRILKMVHTSRLEPAEIEARFTRKPEQEILLNIYTGYPD